ncbi:MAG TPA: GNAT family N-acetyltransferase, partial [Bacteroidales bacterium]|nr:GNAT family N-acetyltransferase [Bacteroidales bacterium]
MFLLDINLYHKALSPLLTVAANHLFARSVVEKHVTGIIYTDDTIHPSAFHVVHPYGMSLLFGITDNHEFYGAIADYMLNKKGNRQSIEWMQAYPQTWNEIIRKTSGDVFVKPDESNNQRVIEVHTRANFRFNVEKYLSIKKNLKLTDNKVVRTDKDLYQKMNGTVVPKYFWNNADDFNKNGVGFTLLVNNEPACTAYSAYIFDRRLELGIETRPEHRGKGFAVSTCCVLIDYCIKNNFEPVWSCRLQNTASYQLAQKLGFEPTI